MPISINYNPLGAIADASRATGFATFLKEQELAQERRRLQEQQMAMQAAQLRAKMENDAANRDMQGRQFQEGQRRFDTNLAVDQGNRQQANFQRQQSLGTQLQAKQQDAQADLAARQLAEQSDQSQLGARLNAGLLEQQMQGEQQMAREAALSQRQAELAALQADGSLRNKLATDDVPENVAMGIQGGALAYSPQQKMEMQQIQESINKARQDRTLTPTERMQFEAQQLQAYRQIRDNPLEVPLDERPVPLPQQFEQETTEVPGLPGRWQRTMRNGSAQWTAVEPPEDPQVKMEQEKQKFAFEQEKFQADQTYKQQTYKLDLEQQRTQLQLDGLKRAQEMELGGLQNQAPEPDDFKAPDTTTAEGKVIPGKPNMQAYNSALTAHQQKVDAVIKRYQSQTMSLTTAQSEAVGSPVGSVVQSPDELRAAIGHGAIQIGDTVMTPVGPRPLTQEVYDKLMGN